MKYQHIDPADRAANLTSSVKVEARITERLNDARDLARSGDVAGADRERFENLEAELDELRDLRDFFRTTEDILNGTVAGHREAGDDRGPEIIRHRDPWADLDRVAPQDLKARAVSAIEATVIGEDEAREFSTGMVERAEDPELARWALLTSQPAYASAFAKIMANPSHGHLEWTPEEAAAYRAVAQWEHQRAMSEGTPSAGGYMVPTHLDPAILLSSSSYVNPIRRLARKVQITTKTWNGVSSAGVSVTFATEFAVVGDGTPTLAQPSIPVYKAHGFVPASFEVIQDVPSLAAQVTDLFREGVDDAEAAAFATGTGTNEPTGIVTALNGTSRATNCTTNSTVTVADFERAQIHTPARARNRGASWLMNLAILQDVRALGTDALGTQTVSLADGAPMRILGDAAYEASAMTSSLNTATNNIAVYGDLSAYVIVDRVGATVEYVPMLVDPDTARPNGSRGWYVHTRVGADSVNDNMLTLLVNPAAT